MENTLDQYRIQVGHSPDLLDANDPKAGYRVLFDNGHEYGEVVLTDLSTPVVEFSINAWRGEKVRVAISTFRAGYTSSDWAVIEFMANGQITLRAPGDGNVMRVVQVEEIPFKSTRIGDTDFPADHDYVVKPDGQIGIVHEIIDLDDVAGGVIGLEAAFSSGPASTHLEGFYTDQPHEGVRVHVRGGQVMSVIRYLCEFALPIEQRRLIRRYRHRVMELTASQIIT